jgi:uncharacterized protein YjbI with pentapeptide repeats
VLLSIQGRRDEYRRASPAPRLYRVDLTETYLNGADLSGAEGLSQEQLDAAFGDVRTELPDDLQRPASWALSVANETEPPATDPSHADQRQ